MDFERYNRMLLFTVYIEVNMSGGRCSGLLIRKFPTCILAAVMDVNFFYLIVTRVVVA